MNRASNVSQVECINCTALKKKAKANERPDTAFGFAASFHHPSHPSIDSIKIKEDAPTGTMKYLIRTPFSVSNSTVVASNDIIYTTQSIIFALFV
jgi:hypothetical protein